MRILVCVKQVGVLGDEIELVDDGTDVDPDFLDRALNDWDAAAIEEALLLREAAGDGEVVLVTVGDDEAEDCLRRGLAMGADRAVRIEVATAPIGDPVAVAALLAGVVRAEQPELVLCGVQSADQAHGATGAALAGHLGWPCGAVVRRLALAGGTADVDRELEGGVLAATDVVLPAVLTIQTGINEPRYATLRAIKQAAEKPLSVLEADDVPASARVLRLYPPPKGAGAELLGDDAAVVAARILELVKGAAR